jgi:protein phosphatase
MNQKPVRLVCDGASHVGCRRDVNEDSLLVAPEIGILAVADGMGGHAAGEVASGLVIETLRDYLSGKQPPATLPPLAPDSRLGPDANKLRAAIHLANARIFESIESRQELRGMGTTIVAALFQGDRLTIGYVGDSRAYLFREGTLRQLTADHSWVQEQVALGLLSPSEAHRHPFRNIVTRALGSREEVLLDIHEERLNPGDTLLLCSDGLNSMLEDHRIEEIIRLAGEDTARACQDLVEAANQAGGEDNITVIVARAVPAEVPAGP